MENWEKTKSKLWWWDFTDVLYDDPLDSTRRSRGSRGSLRGIEQCPGTTDPIVSPPLTSATVPHVCPELMTLSNSKLMTQAGGKILRLLAKRRRNWPGVGRSEVYVPAAGTEGLGSRNGTRVPVNHWHLALCSNIGLSLLDIWCQFYKQLASIRGFKNV